MFARLIAAALPLAAGAAVALPAVAGAYVTPGDAQFAADKAVAWYREAQAANGDLAPGGGSGLAFGGDWSMIALSNAGVNPADLRLDTAAPSLQDFYAGQWSASGPGNSSTDQARALLTGHGGGIRGAQLSATRNLVARQLRFFDGRQLGIAATVNDDIFGLFALQRSGIHGITPTLDAAIRRAQTQGGWNYAANGGRPDVDMTGAGIAALCAAGATAADPAVASALDYLQTVQDDATGGFRSAYFGANTDSTAWVVNGLRECDVDPQGTRWTTASGKTPLDFLVAMQKSNGAFRWRATEADDRRDNLYATQDAITALVGDGFGAEPAPRAEVGQASFRAAPVVAEGTAAPMGLLIDHGPAVAGAERACMLDAPVGGTVADLLAGSEAADPVGCATDVRVETVEGAARLVSVNGVDADDERMWVVRVDGGEPRETLDGALSLGSVVSAELVARPAVEEPLPPTPGERELPPVTPGPVLPPAGAPGDGGTPVVPQQPQALPQRAKVALAAGSRLRVRNARVGLVVRCPRDAGDAGCRGVVRLTYKAAGRGGRAAGSAPFALTAGQKTTVRVALGRPFRRLLARTPRGRVVTIVAATRDQPTRSTTRTTATARVVR